MKPRSWWDIGNCVPSTPVKDRLMVCKELAGAINPLTTQLLLNCFANHPMSRPVWFLTKPRAIQNCGAARTSSVLDCRWPEITLKLSPYFSRYLPMNAMNHLRLDSHNCKTPMLLCVRWISTSAVNGPWRRERRSSILCIWTSSQCQVPAHRSVVELLKKSGGRNDMSRTVPGTRRKSQVDCYQTALPMARLSKNCQEFLRPML